MMKLFFKSIWSVIVVMAAIGGAIGIFFLPFFTGDDYALSLTLKNAEKLIENKHDNVGLTVAFNGKGINALYYTKLQLKNSGKRALTKEYIFEPVTIHSNTPAAILDVSSSSKGVSFSPEKVEVTWSLLNPSETVDLLIYSKSPLELKSTQKIREVTKVSYINEITDPPTSQRLTASKIWWIVFLVLGVYLTSDAISLIRSDVKAQRVLDFINSALKADKVNKQLFLTDLSNLYREYYESGPRLFVDPESLIQQVSAVLDSSEEISGRFLETARIKAIEQVYNGNLYNIRSMSLAIGPLLVGVCIVGSTISLFF